MRDEARPLAEKLLERQYIQAEDAYSHYLRGREMRELLENLQRGPRKTARKE